MIIARDWKNFGEVGRLLGGLSITQLDELVKQKKLELAIQPEGVFRGIYITPESVERYKQELNNSKDYNPC